MQRPADLETELDALLAELPSHVAIGHRPTARLVVSNPGAFVLVPTPLTAAVDLDQIATDTAGLASRTRALLADHLSWVPFVDAVVVTLAGAPPQRAAAVATIDLLVELLTGGPPTVTGATLARVQDLLRASRLGDWRPGVGPADGRIDLCDPMPAPASPSP